MTHSHKFDLSTNYSFSGQVNSQIDAELPIKLTARTLMHIQLITKSMFEDFTYYNDSVFLNTGGSHLGLIDDIQKNALSQSVRAINLMVCSLDAIYSRSWRQCGRSVGGEKLRETKFVCKNEHVHLSSIPSIRGFCWNFVWVLTLTNVRRKWG